MKTTDGRKQNLQVPERVRRPLLLGVLGLAALSQHPEAPALPASPPAHPTFFQQVGDVRLVPVPDTDLPLVSQEGLLLGVIDERVEEEVLENSTRGGVNTQHPRPHSEVSRREGRPSGGQ